MEEYFYVLVAANGLFVENWTEKCVYYTQNKNEVCRMSYKGASVFMESRNLNLKIQEV